MKTVHSISGGKTSSFMAIEFSEWEDEYIFALVEADVHNYHTVSYDNELIKAQNFIRSYLPQFWQTAEDDKTLIAVHDLEKILCKKYNKEQAIKVTSAQRFSKKGTFDAIAKNYLPNARNRVCTEKLKVEPIFYECGGGSEIVKMNIGFRLDEIERTVNLYFNPPPFR